MSRNLGTLRKPTIMPVRRPDINHWHTPLALFALRALSSSAHHQFHRSLDNPAKSQDKLLQRLIWDLARTRYGRDHGVTANWTYAAFSERVPVQTYDSLEHWSTPQIVGRPSHLTPNVVLHFEPTSGSSGVSKIIPYTAPLLNSFARMFKIWAYDLLRSRLRLRSGRIFISVSPNINGQGFVSDIEYLPFVLRALLSPYLVHPEGPNEQEDIRSMLAKTLLMEDKLEIISIWSPSYLLVLLDYIEQNRSEFAALLDRHKRAALLAYQPNWEAIWPSLQLVSCWDAAHAAPLAEQLRHKFPNTLVQGKGLLATEAPMTIPLLDAEGCVPLVDDIFMEFEAECGTIKRLQELTEGERYQLIISQTAGLTRYRLGDIVKVKSKYRQTPTLQFVGRTSNVCDLVGEKLNEEFVRSALQPLIPSGKFLLLPASTAHTETARRASEPAGSRRSQYIILSEEPDPSLADKADAALSQAHHYQRARALGQLQAIQHIRIPNLLASIQDFHQINGMKLGDIKDVCLISDTAISSRLLSWIGAGEPPALHL